MVRSSIPGGNIFFLFFLFCFCFFVFFLFFPFAVNVAYLRRTFTTTFHKNTNSIVKNNKNVKKLPKIFRNTPSNVKKISTIFNDISCYWNSKKEPKY